MSFDNEHSRPQDLKTSSVVPPLRRLLTVVVSGWVIEDGSIVPPKVGNTVSVALQFHQYTPDPADPRTCTVRAWAQPIQADTAPIVDRDGQWWWTIMLRGDGWSAVCRTPRPLIDHVEVTGMFFAHTELGSGTARGLVRRVQLMTGETTYDPHTRGWAAVADEDIRYTDIEASPRWFDRPDPPDPAHADHPVERQLGVLIELDLDAAEPAPLRPRVRPGVISSGGRVLWVLDRQLPVLLQIDDPAGAAVVTEHLLPLSIATTVFRRCGGGWLPTGRAAGSSPNRRCCAARSMRPAPSRCTESMWATVWQRPRPVARCCSLRARACLCCAPAPNR